MLTIIEISLRGIPTPIEIKHRENITRPEKIIQPGTLTSLRNGIQIQKVIIRQRIQETMHQGLIHHRQEIIHPEPLHRRALVQEDRIIAVEEEADNY